MAQSKILAGPHLKCLINGKLLGTVVGGSWQISTQQKDLMGIDQNIPQEIIATTYHVNGTLQLYRLHGDGGPEGQGITTYADSMLMQKYIRIELIDRVTDQVVFAGENAVVLQNSWQVGPKQVMMGTITFRATVFSNEARR